jgi:hypothetical protein
VTTPVPLLTISNVFDKQWYTKGWARPSAPAWGTTGVSAILPAHSPRTEWIPGGGVL